MSYRSADERRQFEARTLSWQQAAVAHLTESKRRGLPWADARRLCTGTVQVPTRDVEASSLFEQHNTVAAFFWRKAQDAYNDVVDEPGSGNGPALRHFSVGMVDDDVRLSPEMAA